MSAKPHLAGVIKTIYLYKKIQDELLVQHRHKTLLDPATHNSPGDTVYLWQDGSKFYIIQLANFLRIMHSHHSIQLQGGTNEHIELIRSNPGGQRE